MMFRRTQKGSEQLGMAVCMRQARTVAVGYLVSLLMVYIEPQWVQQVGMLPARH